MIASIIFSFTYQYTLIFTGFQPKFIDSIRHIDFQISHYLVDILGVSSSNYANVDTRDSNSLEDIVEQLIEKLEFIIEDLEKGSLRCNISSSILKHNFGSMLQVFEYDTPSTGYFELDRELNRVSLIHLINKQTLTYLFEGDELIEKYEPKVKKLSANLNDLEVTEKRYRVSYDINLRIAKKQLQKSRRNNEKYNEQLTRSIINLFNSYVNFLSIGNRVLKRPIRYVVFGESALKSNI